MQLPAGPRSEVGVGSARPTGTPSTRRSREVPKLASTSAPTTAPDPTTRLALPMPPFQPKQTIPVPAPTAPCSTAPAASSARATCAASTSKSRGSLSQLSSHSPTTGITTSSTPTRASAAIAAATAPS